MGRQQPGTTTAPSAQVLENVEPPAGCMQASQSVDQSLCQSLSQPFDLASSLCADSGVWRPHLHSACTCFTLTERSSGFKEPAEPCAGSRLLNTVPCVHCQIQVKESNTCNTIDTRMVRRCPIGGQPALLQQAECDWKLQQILVGLWAGCLQ